MHSAPFPSISALSCQTKEPPMNRLSQIVPLQHDSIVSPYPAAGWRAAFADLGRKGFTGVEIAVTYPERIDVPALCRTLFRSGQ